MEAQRLLDVIEKRAPGFKESILGVAWRHAGDWEEEIGLLAGHPMHLDITMDQVGWFRPTPGLANHRTPIGGLYLSGAGTFPAGGVAGVPGRSAAKAPLINPLTEVDKPPAKEPTHLSNPSAGKKCKLHYTISDLIVVF